MFRFAIVVALFAACVSAYGAAGAAPCPPDCFGSFVEFGNSVSILQPYDLASLSTQFFVVPSPPLSPDFGFHVTNDAGALIVGLSFTANPPQSIPIAGLGSHALSCECALTQDSHSGLILAGTTSTIDFAANSAAGQVGIPPGATFDVEFGNFTPGTVISMSPRAASSPAPEPGTFALAFLGLAVCLAGSTRRSRALFSAASGLDG